MERWVVLNKKSNFQEIGRKFGIDPVIARLIRNRDVIGEEAIEEYLHGGIQQLHDPMKLKDMQVALELLDTYIRQGKHIRIIGDYDIDGVMSTYILLQGLQQVGARVDTRIPNRITDGYGLNESLVQQAHDEGVELILTCDNGIAAAQQIAVAKKLGMQVIVTDHHEVPYEEHADGSRTYLLPPADAVINPKQKECSYPFDGLCGAGVAYKLVCALYDWFGIPQEKGLELLQYAAFATIGDVMDLQGENRVIVKEGLKLLRKTSNQGLLALMQQCTIDPEQVDVYHIGFVLGPCLNASGRLDTAKRALSMLCASGEEAYRLAGDLKALNDSRKELTLKGTEEAIRMVEESSLMQDRVLVVYLPECHESLAGIIAGRLRERFHKPSFVLTRSEEGVKGSGRSIEAYSMYEELCRCRELLTKFGGHPMAAGISLKEGDVVHFRKKINGNCTLTERDLTEKVTIDLVMPIAYVNRSLISQMELLQPFGKGNTKPLFAQKNLTVLGVRIFGKNRNVAKLQIKDEHGFAMDGVYFGEAEQLAAYVSQHPVLSLTYYPGINSYMGRDTLQITIQNYQ
ncbi:MAG: single-stranded-DNA-specific exonuclease RecJ [Lachnospiraceae bacterium]|nr:single-stranded-DNA-specific exonuclease RecJ [Lachnospiraceae bacterium]